MRKIIVYIAASLDGYIARENGSIDWLPDEDPDEDYGYNDFLKLTDTVLMGRKTYEQLLTFGEFPYKDKKCYVFSTNANMFDRNVEFVDKNIECFAGNIKHHDGADIWLTGGSEIIAAFLKAGLIDEFRIFIIPVLIGSGIPLFTKSSQQTNLILKNSKQYSSGIVEINYQINKV